MIDLIVKPRTSTKHSLDIEHLSHLELEKLVVTLQTGSVTSSQAGIPLFPYQTRSSSSTA